MYVTLVTTQLSLILLPVRAVPALEESAMMEFILPAQLVTMASTSNVLQVHQTHDRLHVSMENGEMIAQTNVHHVTQNVQPAMDRIMTIELHVLRRMQKLTRALALVSERITLS